MGPLGLHFSTQRQGCVLLLLKLSYLNDASPPPHAVVPRLPLSPLQASQFSDILTRS